MKNRVKSDFNDTPYNRDYSISLLHRIISEKNNNDAYTDYRLVISGEERKVAKRISEIITKNKKTAYLGLLSIRGSTPEYRHAVGLMIDTKNKKIIYQDPKGAPINPVFKKAIIDTFANHDFIDLQMPQQKNDINCAVITIDNLLKLLEGNNLEKTPDTQKLRHSHSKIMRNRPRN